MLTLRAFRPILAFIIVTLLLTTAITAKKPQTAAARAGPSAQMLPSLMEIGYPAWGHFG